MQCPSCQHTDSRVLESRAADCGRSVRRRRECLNCDFRFTTYERVETVPITVVKRNSNRETFNRSKLLHGVLRACSEIGELVLAQLGEMSEVAYVRFASVYRQFQGVSDFVATLEGLNQRTKLRSKTKPSLAAIG